MHAAHARAARSSARSAGRATPPAAPRRRSMRLGRIRSASFTSRRSRISPWPSRFGWRVCMATTSGRFGRSSKTSSHVITRSRAGIELISVFSSVVFPAWVPPATMMLSPGRHRGLEEAGGVCGDGAERDQVVEAVRGHDELADVQAEVLAGDVRDHRVQPAPVRQQRVDERRGQVEPPAGRLEHPLDQVAHLVGGQHDGRQLGAAVPGDEHPAGLVDPDLLDASGRPGTAAADRIRRGSRRRAGRRRRGPAAAAARRPAPAPRSALITSSISSRVDR